MKRKTAAIRFGLLLISLFGASCVATDLGGGGTCTADSITPTNIATVADSSQITVSWRIGNTTDYVDSKLEYAANGGSVENCTAWDTAKGCVEFCGGAYRAGSDGNFKDFSCTVTGLSKGTTYLFTE